MSKGDLRAFIAFFLLAAALAPVYFLPKPKYTSPDVLSTFKIPARMKYWQSRDVSDRLDIRDKRYAFVSKILVRQYVNDLGESLLFMVLDAGNFHHPKVCFSASGFSPMPQPDIQTDIRGKKINVKSIYMQKKDASVLVVYWITINGRPVNWTSQKFAEFYYSLIGKQKTSFMGRMDIPVHNGNIAASVELAKEFIKDLSGEITETEASLLFGRDVS